MALKIVHLCDVHSSKGEDIPAAFAHTMSIDGGTFAIDLCPQCDAERFLPLVGFLDAFGLLTDGAVDPRAAVAEDLRKMYADQTARPKLRAVAAPPAPVPPARPESPSVPAVSAPDANDPQGHSDAILRALSAHPDGLSMPELAAAIGLAEGYVSAYASPLRKAGKIEFLGRRWWLPEHVPSDLRDDLQKRRDMVQVRDSIPRVCIVDGETFRNTKEWQGHCLDVHGAKSADVLGLACPIDGEEFDTAQLLGMHGRVAHECVHTPQLFGLADELGDSLGVIAAIRARFA